LTIPMEREEDTVEAMSIFKLVCVAWYPLLSVPQSSDLSSVSFDVQFWLLFTVDQYLRDLFQILRFMNDPNLAGRRETLLGDYIVQKGLSNVKLRDEIYCQLMNQTWHNPSESNLERGWLLISNCLSCFQPSPRLHRYLLK
jgi:hypothetical protein